MQFKFSFPTDIRFGVGVIKGNPDVFSAYKRAYIVTGKRSGHISGALADVTAMLDAHSVAYEVFEGIGNNPDVEQCREVGAAARKFHADCIIGIGGGSPLDAAKAVAAFAANDINAQQLFEMKFENGVLPIIAVPTTSGTGSEVTPWSVMTRHDLQTKRSFGNTQTYPRFALLDPMYTAALPRDITVNTAMDAFTHCFESIISVKANPITDAMNVYALEQFTSCMAPLAAGEFDAIREKLMLVSMLGGITISQTGTTLMHGMGYPITYFHHVPHGAANTMVLPVYLEAVGESRPERLEFALNALGISARALADYARKLRSIDFELTSSMIQLYAAQTAQQGSSKNTGIPCEPADIAKLYERMRA